MLFRQGVELLVYGMGTVVVFLTLLVFAMRLMSTTMLRYFPEPELEPEASGGDGGDRPEGAPVPAEVLAAITAALHRHRGDRH